MSGYDSSGGRDANESSELLKRRVVDTFKLRGVGCIEYRHGQHEDMFQTGKRLISDVPYRTVYDTPKEPSHSKCFVYYQDDTLTVRIMCVSQQSSGSVDQKYPYYLENAKAMKSSAVWIILSGQGARAGAVAWLRNNAEIASGKVIRIYTENEAAAAIRGLVEDGVTDVIPRDHGRRRMR